MMYYGPGMGGWGDRLDDPGNVVFWGLLILGAVAVIRYTGLGRARSSSTTESSTRSITESSPQQILAQRFARGEINEDEYQRRLHILSKTSDEQHQIARIAVWNGGSSYLRWGNAGHAGEADAVIWGRVAQDREQPRTPLHEDPDDAGATSCASCCVHRNLL